MATDKESHWLITGDTDGAVKVWDISEHCLRMGDEIITKAPRKFTDSPLQTMNNKYLEN